MVKIGNGSNVCLLLNYVIEFILLFIIFYSLSGTNWGDDALFGGRGKYITK